MNATTFDPVAIAQVCHEANRAVRTLLDDSGSNPSWEDASDEVRESAIAGVADALEGRTSEELHIAWMTFKEAHGWTYGEVKDDDAKTHPCLVSYEELPPEQRAKDRLFQAIVTALADPNDQP